MLFLKFWVARDDGLDARKRTLHIKQWPRRYEQVEQGSCADPGIFVRRAGGRGGGEGVEARRPENSLVNVFFSHQLILQITEWIQWFWRGSNFSQGVGVSKETDITCDFPGGGPDPLTPLWIRTWGRLTPLFAYRIMVYPNLKKKQKNTTQRRLNGKKLSPAGRDSKCGSIGVSGGPDPPGKLRYMGFYRV